ncbi:hypothetical protein EVAR_57462_1 [Eumeta japonica]|uniref:BESS domain-containing protein n=1 Tax=Eumeta variegata TaxID=151549 RepID=A0A4C1ZBN6_EUMVA|nr:hypothetical protein EVAR_57462_1 [Eumeta japonica]
MLVCGRNAKCAPAVLALDCFSTAAVYSEKVRHQYQPLKVTMMAENRSQVSSQDSLDNISSPPPSVNSALQLPSQTPSPSSTPELPSFPRKRKDDTSNQMFCLITQRLSQQKDDFDIFGRNVASKLRTMTIEQKIFAEKLINDVIFNGQMELLSINSVINVRSENLHNTNDNFNNQPFYKPGPVPVPDHPVIHPQLQHDHNIMF